jgi:3-hydroxyisobutyrate dehydrogenase-like beta-hydroxyacid dehydrogenase
MTPAHRDDTPDAPVPAPSLAGIPRHRVGIIGLGLMGSAFAERLLRTGHEVLVWNRTRDKADALVEGGAQWTDRPLRDCDTVLVCLYTDEVVRSVLESMRADWRPGLEVIDSTTGDPGAACVMAAELESCGVSYQEAPVSGSSAQVRDGLATVFVGGTSEAFQRQALLWPVLGARVLHCGPWGSASRLKLITNLVLGLNRLALAEGLAYAEAMGVDGTVALEAMKGSMAYSRAMDAKGTKMLLRDYTPQARLSQHLKDLRLILESARQAGLDLPLGSLHARLLQSAESAGMGDLDNSAVMELLRLRADSSQT